MSGHMPPGGSAISPSMHRVINFIGFQGLWLLCVMSAGAGQPWVGPLAGVVLLALHLATTHKPAAEARLIAAACAVGYVFDSALVLSGVIAFPESAAFGAPSTIWMVTLWAGFAATMRSSMQWLVGSPVLAAVLGVVGGPLSYLAGSRLGAISLPQNLVVSLGAVALVWALAMPLLVWLEKQTRGAASRVEAHHDEELAL